MRRKRLSAPATESAAVSAPTSERSPVPALPEPILAGKPLITPKEFFFVGGYSGPAVGAGPRVEAQATVAVPP